MSFATTSSMGINGCRACFILIKPTSFIVGLAAFISCPSFARAKIKSICLEHSHWLLKTLLNSQYVHLIFVKSVRSLVFLEPTLLVTCYLHLQQLLAP